MSNLSLKYNVNGVLKTGFEITYDDCVVLYTQFIEKHNHYPKQREQTVANNVPHSKVLQRVLSEKKLLLSDWQVQFGKTGVVRSDPCFYNVYLERYKQKCNQLGRALKMEELSNIQDLPNCNFFVRYCPDSTVKTYDEFVLWCGYKSNKGKSVDEVIEIIYQMQEEKDSPLTLNDFRHNKYGISATVIQSIWGTWTNCQKTLNLPVYSPRKDTDNCKEIRINESYKSQKIQEQETNIKKYRIILTKPFSYYQNKLDNALKIIESSKQRRVIYWKDLEDKELLGEYRMEHKTITQAFKRENIDIHQYIMERGFIFQPNSWGISEYTEDGELLKSSYEIDFTNFLRDELGLVYNQTYYRDIRYSTFCDIKPTIKIDCDYVFYNNKGDIYCIEIAGMLYQESELESYIDTKRKEQYRIKMIDKIQKLNDNNINYLILYGKDMRTEQFKYKTKQFLYWLLENSNESNESA